MSHHTGSDLTGTKKLAYLKTAWLTGSIVLLLWLTGCATPRTTVTDPSAHWSGRMAVQLLKEPPESMSASFELHGSAQKGEMLLFSPIGTTLAHLEWTPEQARLTQGNQQMESSNLHRLVTRLTNTELPLAALFEWLAGHSVDTPGWQVDLSGHAQGRITAERSSPAPRAMLRIVLDR